jgi:hypothetical protein
MAPVTEHSPPIAPGSEADSSADESRRLSRKPLFRVGT